MSDNQANVDVVEVATMTSAVEFEYSDVWEFESANWTLATAGLGALEPWQTAGLALLAGGVSLVTICGNLIVLLSFMLERSIRQPCNYFIASLAVSDLLIGIHNSNFIHTDSLKEHINAAQNDTLITYY